jgi:methylated-DNA-[protein]-cysteine S-methyltransferase
MDGRAYYHSPIGTIEIVASDQGITTLEFIRGKGAPGRTPSGVKPLCLSEAVSQLHEYFLGRRTAFSLSLVLAGTAFQKKVWLELLKVPYGRTTSYKEIANKIGKPKAVRAVGGANHRNPISIIIPCHRVIGTDGRLVGYGGGLSRKEWLLDHEQRGDKPGGREQKNALLVRTRRRP